MARIQRWWWPLYVFLYPLLFIPWELNVLESNYAGHVALTLLFLGVGGLMEGLSHPHLSAGSLRHLPGLLWAYKPVLAGLLLGIWAVVAAFFTAEPTFALMGTLPKDGGGALHILALALMFALIVVQALRDRGLVARLIGAMVLSGAVLAGLGVVEAVFRHGLIYPLDAGLFPRVTLPQRGHYAGFLTLSLALALGLWLRNPRWAGAVIPLTAFAIGLTLTRTAIFAALLAGAAGVLFSRFSRNSVLALILVALGLGGGMRLIETLNTTRSDSSAQVRKDFADGTTGATRLIYWQTALRGIMAQPVFGWGAGGFDYVFPNYMTREEIENYLRLELGFKQFVELINTPGAPPIFVVKDQEDKTQLHSSILWKCHNQFLDLGLRLGWPGLILYLLLLLSTWRSLLQLKPAALALWVHHAFLFFWFVPFHTEGVVWVLMACAVLEGIKQKQAARQDKPAAQPVAVGLPQPTRKY
ncbi:MAG: O-antigen ligase family protein [Meiothermus sp.]|nr:O-antigen ligase family protein [Meiothermus sp.]